jgi:hypothetical protein
MIDNLKKLEKFNQNQIKIVNNSVAMAEELVSNFYKLSANQWLRHRYDVKTLSDLSPDEIVHGPFAQIIRYEGQRKDTSLGSSTFDFYKICLQDYSILSVVKQSPGIKLFPFTLYIVIHELIHIVRFSKFLQNFDASDEEKMVEETRVHKNTHEILNNLRISGLSNVLRFYDKWRRPLDKMRNT